MPVSRIASRWILLTLLAGALSQAACFDFGDRPPPVGGGSIEGTVLVATASGQSLVGGENASRQRHLVAVANKEASGVAPDVPTPTGRGQKASDARAQPSKMPMEWRAGDALVMFDDAAYDKQTLGPALRQMVKAADLRVEAEVVRCSAKLYCKVRLYGEDGALLDKDQTADVVARLDKVRAPKVKVVARNMKKWGMRVPNDPLLGFQWHYNAIHLQAAWDITRGDPNLVVAIVDSGLVQAHPDLNARIARDPLNNTLVGADLISHPDIEIDGNGGRDTDPEDPGDGAFDGRSTFHGTHIAGTIGAETDNGEGVAGITWFGQIVPVRVLGKQLAGFDDDITDGVLWAVGDQNIDGVPKNVKPAKIVNLSFGGPGDDASQTFWNELINRVLTDAQYNNPILVAAAGNSDEDARNILPANVPNMIAVGAHNIQGLRASYSNYGATVDIMAPGGEGGTDANSDGQPDSVLSTVQTDYDYREGTSMATPHVVGVAALLLSLNPALKQADVESILKTSANPAGKCSEGCGAGWLDAVSALLLAGGTVRPEPFMAVDSPVLPFPAGVQQLQMRVLNLGNAPFDFSTRIGGAQADLFTVSPSTGTVPAAGPDGSITLTVRLNRGDFDAGSANLTITTTSAAPDPAQELTVDLGFNDDPTRAPRLVQQVEVAAYKQRSDGSLQKKGSAIATRDGDFQYKIEGLPPGDYLVYAVGDDNNDGTFAADFESFGAYPTRVEPHPVTVEEDAATSGIDVAIDAQFITDIAGGVGAPCQDKNDCTFADDADCIDSFEGGYCTRLCDDGFCGDHASCELMDCDGGSLNCNICLIQCANDNQCRFADGYVCDLGSCVPEFLQIGN
jgi:serine protease